MVFKNFFQRVLISLFFILAYLLISYYSFDYIFYLIIIIYLFIFFEVFLNFKKLKYFILSYLFIGFIIMLNIEYDIKYFKKFNLMILIIIFFDIFSYFIGSMYGKNYILPKISPNKTLEGFLGGVFFSFLISFIYTKIIQIDFNLKLIIFVTIIIFSSFIGDIMESIFKRKNNLKNSSNFLPGHGGFFDRFDSFILSLVAYYFLYKIL